MDCGKQRKSFHDRLSPCQDLKLRPLRYKARVLTTGPRRSVFGNVCYAVKDKYDSFLLSFYNRKYQPENVSYSYGGRMSLLHYTITLDILREIISSSARTDDVCVLVHVLTWECLTDFLKFVMVLMGGIYRISSCGQPTVGSPPAWRLGGWLKLSHLKLNNCYKSLRTASEQDGLLGTT
jgi:hypothetical protein